MSCGFTTRLCLFLVVLLFSDPVCGIDPVYQKLIQEYDYLGAERYLTAQINSPDSKKRSPEQQARMLCKLCETSNLLVKFAEGRTFGLQALGMSNTLRDSSLMTEIQLCLATAQSHLIENKNILYYFNQTKPYVKKRNEPRLSRLWNYSYGSFLLAYVDPLLGFDHIKKSYQLSKKYNLEDVLLLDALLLGTSYLAIGNLDSALFHLNEGLALASQRKDSLFIAKSHLGLAYYYSIVGDIYMENQNLEAGKQIALKKGYFNFLIGIYSFFMHKAMFTQDFDAVVKYGLEAEKCSPGGTYLVQQAFIDSLTYQAYKYLNNPSKAMYYLERFQSSSSKIYRQNFEAQIKENEYLQNLQERIFTIENQKLALQNQQKSKKILLIVNILIITIVVSGIAFQRIRKSYIRILYNKEKWLDNKIGAENDPFPAYDPLDLQNPPDQAEEHPVGNGVMFHVKNRKKLFQEMVEVIQQKKLYLQPDFCQNDLVAMLGTNKKYLYEAISQYAGENFKSLLNRLRVDEAKKLIQEIVMQNSTVLPSDLYIKAGFNSTASYYRVFKEFTGLTPKEYANEYLLDRMNS